MKAELVVRRGAGGWMVIEKVDGTSTWRGGYFDTQREAEAYKRRLMDWPKRLNSEEEPRER